jgi:3-hydroxyacyl-[acyl-carrier-protein] dehydratase
MMPPTARPRTLFSLTINKAKFRKPVRPGDTLEYHVDKLAQRRNTYRTAARRKSTASEAELGDG